MLQVDSDVTPHRGSSIDLQERVSAFMELDKIARLGNWISSQDSQICILDVSRLGSDSKDLRLLELVLNQIRKGMRGLDSKVQIDLVTVLDCKPNLQAFVTYMANLSGQPIWMARWWFILQAVAFIIFPAPPWANPRTERGTN